ncbi:unnamed protein product, partial [Polarella glacialis]
EMPDLQNLVFQMTQRSHRQRPSAAGALQHAWFKSDSDADLPGSSLLGLLGSSASSGVHQQVLEQLASENNLDELRGLHAIFQAADATGQGRLAAARVAQLLRGNGTNEGAAQEFAERHSGPDGTVRYGRVMQESIQVKERYAHHFIKDLFEALDVDKTGSLSTVQLQVLLDSDAFECPFDDIEELMAEMVPDQDGMVSFEEFKRTLLADGRIGRRSTLEAARCKRGCVIM